MTDWFEDFETFGQDSCVWMLLCQIILKIASLHPKPIYVKFYEKGVLNSTEKLYLDDADD